MHAISDLTFRLGFPVAILVTIWLRRRPQWIRNLSSESWPIALGTIENGTVSVIHSGRGEVALCTLNYSYSIDGAYYGGGYLQQFSDEQEAYDYIGSKTGKAAQVEYNPQKPGASVLMHSI